ncbi:beta-ketoacyl synthase N-terminal-like domain-containing protein [Salinactinospora qingdaonensis]|uniref:Acyl transferase domain-containing protein n=1 Tax=Salinactinospora qingdaonensis TaxID=702744 RepID=A0ABP7G6C7_9ACTN
MSTDLSEEDPNAVALIGLACRFGSAGSAEELWELMGRAQSTVRRYSSEELLALGHDRATLDRSGFVPAGSALADAEAFDAEFFGYSPQHAEWLDPQQRLLLETSWHALEDACIAPRGTGLRTAVFTSVGQPASPPLSITDLDAAGMVRFSSTDKDFAATRLSYKLGLDGPSMTVQTACSSSLVGVHLAVESLLDEECDAALVGGASLHFPQAGYTASRDMILSPTGGCRPFDDSADGTVFGNGVGAVVLRRLADAVADGDPVRAVIRGSAVNNDGARKMDFHAPSPEGQEAVLREALVLGEVDPSTVGYVEAHGTGTHMGDTVEFSALARVYGGDRRAEPCLLGSVKNTVGHTNTAAGVAGLIRAVLCLEHGQVPAQHDFRSPNSQLSRAGSGLVVGEGAAHWPVTSGPRRAAVSSFGIGGTNAHVVLEQAPEPKSAPQMPAGPQIVALSARSVEALEETAGRLADALERSPQVRLADVAATLTLGREHERERLAVVCDDVATAIARLRDGGDLVRGTVDRVPADDGPKPQGGEDAASIARSWVEGRGQLPEPASQARRVRLPGYPFARRRWPRPGAGGEDPPRLSGMLDRNVSTLEAVRFERVLLPEEPLVADHVVDQEPVLPAAAYVDMALAAAQEALGAPVTGLRDVTIHRPLRVRARTRLLAEVVSEKQDTTVRVRSQQGAESVAHMEATVVTGEPVSVPTFEPDDQARSMPVEDLYRRFAAGGVEYGPAFRVLERLSRGADGAVATVVAADAGDHRVSPFLLDGVLQAVLGCLTEDDLDGETFVPFGVGRIDVLDDVPSRAHVHVRPVSSRGGGRRVRVFDLTVQGDGGAVVLRLNGLALRPVSRASATVPEGVHLYRPTTEALAPAEAEVTAPVVLYGTDAQAAACRDALGVSTVVRDVSELPHGDRRAPVVVWPLPEEPDLRAQVVAVFRMLRDLVRTLSRRGGRIVIPYPKGAAAGPGIAAVGRSLAAENPRVFVTAVEVAPQQDMATTVAGALATAAGGGDVLKNGRTTVLSPLRIRPRAGGRPFTVGGRYWINGMGHLAEALAAHLLDRYGAHVVLTGRSQDQGERGAVLERLSAAGGTVEYHRLDCTDSEAVGSFAAGIEPVQGVFHCAGVLRDSFVANKTPETAWEVVAPKLLGAMALDEATAHWELDHFVMFSSVSAPLGSLGQADYAFANAAMDTFAHQRSRRRSGRTLSIAWPYWSDGGMGGDTAEEMLGRVGMAPLTTGDGLMTLEALLSGEDVPVDPVVLAGDRERLTASFPQLRTDEPESPVARQEPTAGRSGADRDAVVGHIAAAVAEAAKIPLDQIVPERTFEELGLDSLLVVRTVELLERNFGPLAKTLLFEFQTVGELADHLLSEHAEQSAALEAPVSVDTPPPPPEVSASPAESHPARGQDAGAIAIIGMAGRYPQGEDLDEFWRMLLEGTDCVTEVPSERWDADALYDPDRERSDRTYTKWGSFLDGVTDFDAPLFNLSPREASITDPQARLFLENCWATLEDAGYRPDDLTGLDDPLHQRDVGVFVGAMYGEYQLHEAEERLRGNPILANSSYWSIANRVSYFFDFQGPSVAVDTACSSALTAIQLACESLRAGSCRVAVAGGVNVLIHPNKYFMLGQGRFASSDGRCRSFGAGGDGYVPGEGVGSVLLKPLTEAIAAGDHIHGVIRGSAVNHGGRTSGYTVPNPKAQADLITKALRDASLTAGELDYIEAHGTGTALGDPIEVRGLTSAFARDEVTRAGSVPIGSVKSNLGHLESAAGVVALHKVLLQMQHATLVPSIHATPPNPEIDFDATPFVVQQRVAPWRSRSGEPLRAGISSFGAGGANAHLVVEQAPERAPRSGASAGPVVVFLSARTDSALAAYAQALHDHVAETRPELDDIAYTFAVGRAELARRRAVPAGDLDELLEGLSKVAHGAAPAGTAETADWEAGGAVDKVAACGAAGRGRRIPLPTYPFERVRCWYDLQIEHLNRSGGVSDPPARTHLRDFGRAAHSQDPTPEVAVQDHRETSDPPKGETVSRDRKIALRSLAPPETSAEQDPPTPSRPPVSGAVPPAGPAAAEPAPAEEASQSPPLPPHLERELSELLASVLYLAPEELDPRLTFQDLGVDSILGVEFVSLVNERFGVSIKATVLYDHPTPSALAGHVAGLLHEGEQTAAPPSAPAAPLQEASAPAAPTSGQRTSEVFDVLRARLADVLYSSEADLGEDQPFSELGLDSVLGVEFTRFINSTYGLELKADVLYDHPNLRALSRHVGELLTPSASSDAESAPPSDTDTVLAAVRDNKLTVDQALGMLQALSAKEWERDR